LSARLATVLGQHPGIALDSKRWDWVYVFGIVPLIRVPRDVVRYINAISVTFPAVADEVNPIDFFAIEAIRIFLPKLYDLIRSNESKVTGWGSSRRTNADSSLDAFRSAWDQSLPSEVRDDFRTAVYCLFPGIGGQTGDSKDVLPEWRRDRRICHPELFHIYFRLSLLPGAVSHGK
jgi:predicted KAP-like P-loop ATPase